MIPSNILSQKNGSEGYWIFFSFLSAQYLFIWMLHQSWEKRPLCLWLDWNFLHSIGQRQSVLSQVTQWGMGEGENLTDKQTDQTRHFKEKKKCKNEAIRHYSPSMLWNKADNPLHMAIPAIQRLRLYTWDLSKSTREWSLVTTWPVIALSVLRHSEGLISAFNM